MITAIHINRVSHQRRTCLVLPCKSRRYSFNVVVVLSVCWYLCVAVVLLVAANEDLATSSLLSDDTDDIINDLIAAELSSTKNIPPVSVEEEEEVGIAADRDDNEEIIVLDDDVDDVDDTANASTNSTIDTTISNTTLSSTPNTTTATATSNGNSSATIHVQSNLQSLTDDELIAICTERGYEITVPDDNGEEDSNRNGTKRTVQLTHDDYVAAATQCLSLDKVVDQMIADDPDLAADMDYEVERIRIEKEKLQKEQETILQEISSLEDALRQSGVDPTTLPVEAVVPSTTLRTAAVTQKNLTDWTVDEVLFESFEQLFDRVGNDLQLVARMVQSIIVQPTWIGMSLIWRYTSPTILDAVVRPVVSYSRRHIVPPLQQVFVQIQPYITPLQQIIVHQYSTVRDTILLPALQRYNSTIIRTHLQQWYHQQRAEVQLGIRIVGAFVVPLYQSLSTGYRIIVQQPMVHNITLSLRSLLQ